MTDKIPKRVFIVPYRNRLEQKFFFSNQMSFILEDMDDYEIYFSHQCDSRQFNRGAMKNIGFLSMKKKYPLDYKNITFIFNDVDTLPFHKIFDYETTAGMVKHHYGFEYALGGIVVIKGVDFERINGFPNFWGWGNEDSVLQTRCNKYNLKIDRGVFYKIGSPEILQLFDGVSRLISPNEYSMGKNDKGVDGLTSIKNLSFSIDVESLNPNDNKYIVKNSKIFVINIITFNSLISVNQNDFYDYDLREKPNKIINPDPSKLQMTKKVMGTEDWVNIPQLNNETNPIYKKEIQRFKNKQLENPQQIEERIIQENLKINNDKNKHMLQQQELVNNYISRLKNSQLTSSIPHPQRQPQQKPPPHRYSKEYASYIGAKSRATSSMGVNINLGGLSVKR
jgi:hypothetical protein